MRILEPADRNLGFRDSDNFMIKFSVIKDLLDFIV